MGDAPASLLCHTNSSSLTSEAVSIVAEPEPLFQRIFVKFIRNFWRNRQVFPARFYSAFSGPVLFVTHNIQEALTLGDRLIVLAQGGQVVLNEENTLPRPVLPSTPGFSEVWNRLSAMLDR